MTDAMVMATAERHELAEFLATLTSEEWDAPSLCTGWSVKDVVCHVISYEDLGTGALLARLARGRFLGANQIGVDKMRHLDSHEVLEAIDTHLTPKGLTSRGGGMIGLVDGTIHHHDIRRALGRPRHIPEDRLLRVMNNVPSNPRLFVWRRIRGLHLRATDISWTHGNGPEVSGPAEALMMAMSGRSQALPELSGPGLPTLEARTISG